MNPEEEYRRLQEDLDDMEDLLALRQAKEAEGAEAGMDAAELRRRLGL